MQLRIAIFLEYFSGNYLESETDCEMLLKDDRAWARLLAFGYCHRIPAINNFSCKKKKFTLFLSLSPWLIDSGCFVF